MKTFQQFKSDSQQFDEGFKLATKILVSKNGININLAQQ